MVSYLIQIKIYIDDKFQLTRYGSKTMVLYHISFYENYVNVDNRKSGVLT